MNQILSFLLLFISLPFSLMSSDFIEITDKNFKTLSLNKPIVAIFTLSCDLGSYAVGMFSREFSDVEGIQIGAIDINKSKALYSDVYSLYQKTNTKLGDKGITLGTYVLIANGKVVHTTQMDYPNRPNSQYGGGLEANRRWLNYALNKNKISFNMKYKPIQEERAKPKSLPGKVDLENSKLAYYDFSDLKDKIGIQKDFSLKGNASIHSGTLYSDGKYDSKYTTSYFLFKNKSDEPYSKEYSLSLNFKMISEGRGTIFALGYNLFEVSVINERLRVKIDPSYQRGTEGAIGSWYYILDETKIPMNQWQNIILSMDSKTRRIMIRLNGKRLDDIIISNRLAEEMLNYKPGSTFHGGSLGIEFSNHSRGAVYHGYIDNLTIYNRLLNDSEQIALYRKYRPEGQADVTEVASNDNQEYLNWQLLSASYKGDYSLAKEAIDNGADINIDNKNWTALMYASYYGHESVVALLIESKADVLKDMKGWTAQKFAEAQGHTKIATMLNDYSNSREFYFQRSFPSINHRSIVQPAELKMKRKK